MGRHRHQADGVFKKNHCDIWICVWGSGAAGGSPHSSALAELGVCVRTHQCTAAHPRRNISSAYVLKGRPGWKNWADVKRKVGNRDSKKFTALCAYTLLISHFRRFQQSVQGIAAKQMFSTHNYIQSSESLNISIRSLMRASGIWVQRRSAPRSTLSLSGTPLSSRCERVVF